MQDDEFLRKHEIFEKKVMDMLLVGDHEFFSILRKQYEMSKIRNRDFDGYGFFTSFEVPAESPRLAYSMSPVIGDVIVDYDGRKDAFGLILFVASDSLDCLEGYPYGGSEWIGDYDRVDDIRYVCEAKPHERGVRGMKSLIRESMPGLRWEPKTGPLALKFEPKDEAYLKKHGIFEKKVMDMLLFGDNELFARLRRQYESALVIRRGFDDCGFITDFEVGDRSLAIADRSFILGDVRIESSSTDRRHNAVLFIDDGLISCLVGYPSSKDDWLDYHHEDVRMYYATD
ncbi:MAG: hypothetical protein LBU15_01455, partial [Rickettsiales bacterium]|nr:hypothetical protein [Rickettsiales bacterium]